MTSTTTRRPPTASILATSLFLLGLAAFVIVPVSCNPEPDETSKNETTQIEGNPDRSILLNIGIEDETEERPLSDAFLLETPSGTRWTPGLQEGRWTTKAFEKHPVGETRTLRIYPEGKDGPALEVPITMKSDMSSALASSRTAVVVYDDSIVVSGPAVPDERMTFDRASPSSTP